MKIPKGRREGKEGQRGSGSGKGLGVWVGFWGLCVGFWEWEFGGFIFCEGEW